VAVQEALDDLPPLLLLQGAAGSGGQCRHLEARDELALGRPAQEVPDVVAGRRISRQPDLDVSLGELSRRSWR